MNTAKLRSMEFRLVKQQKIRIPSFGPEHYLRFANPDKSHIFQNSVIWEDRRNTLEDIRNQIGSMQIGMALSREVIREEYASNEPEPGPLDEIFEKMSKECAVILAHVNIEILAIKPETDRVKELFWFDIKKIMMLFSNTDEDEEWTHLASWIATHIPLCHVQLQDG